MVPPWGASWLVLRVFGELLVLAERSQALLGTNVGLMDVEAQEPAGQDVGVDRLQGLGTERPSMGGAPNWRALAAVGAAIVALVAVYTLGRSATPTPVASPIAPAVTAVPSTLLPAATTTPEPAAPPELVDLLGEGSVLAELELGNRSRAVLWCRESVPGTPISSTLALIHIRNSIQFGDQVVLYEELTKPWVPSGSFRRGSVFATEGLGAIASAAPLPEEEDSELLEPSDGQRCESCAPTQVTVGTGDVLVGTCVHGVPFRASTVYVIAPPVRLGQTPLALHVSCGITNVRVDNDQVVIESETPLVRGLQDERFLLPTISFSRDGGRFVASDLGLLDWNCDIERSTQLADRHLLRTEPTRSISYQRVESAIGEIGVHGPMVFGLTADQCSMLTRAWWGQSNLEDPSKTPIADLVGFEPPAGEVDWFYGCDR